MTFRDNKYFQEEEVRLHNPLDEVYLLELNKLDLEYVIIKYPYLAKKESGDIDILLSEDSYVKLYDSLLKNDFNLVFSEADEKYKSMFCKVTNKKRYSFHLHRKVAWNGLIALDAQKILSRKRKYLNFFVPSIDDEFLIHTAHILFELHTIRNYEKNIFSSFTFSDLDNDYFEIETKKFGWHKDFFKIHKLGKITNKYFFKIKITLKRPSLLINFFSHYLKAIERILFKKNYILK